VPPSVINRIAVPERVENRATWAGADEAALSFAVDTGSVVEGVSEAGTILLHPVVWRVILSALNKSPSSGLSVDVQGGVGDARVSTTKLSLERRSISRNDRSFARDKDSTCSSF
jgi:hypothetical protein